MFPEPTIDPSAYVAGTARIHGDVTVGAKVVVMFGAVLRSEVDRIVIGAETNIQDNAVMHSDYGCPVIVGSRVTVGHAAVVHGATVGDHGLVGIGARMLNGSELGEGAWLAAGSVLSPNAKIPPWTLAVGIPARPFRALKDEEIEYQDLGVTHYLGFAEQYRTLGA